MVDKIDKIVKEHAKKVAKKYKEIRKKHSDLTKTASVGISLISSLLSEKNADIQSAKLKAIMTIIPSDLIKKGALDKIADSLINKLEKEHDLDDDIHIYLQEYLSDQNVNGIRRL